MLERLQKYIARCGVTSRRKAEELIFEGRVKVNNEVVKEIISIDITKDEVEVDGKVISLPEDKIYIALNKPVGIITSAKDQFNRRTVIDVVGIKERIYPVGRLDYDTSGLIILTNDGDVTNRLMHPSQEVNKVYIATVKGTLTEDEINRFKNGLYIDGYKTSSAGLRVIKAKGNVSTIEVIIHEGRNRQVRKMCDSIGHPVISLHRVKIGKIEIGSLKQGEWRNLTNEEINYIKGL